MTNVALRNLSTALVIEEMFAGTSAIYVDYTSYDAVAHHVGPERAEAVDSLAGIDQAISILAQAAEDAPRPYRIVVLSDHGQSLGSTFRQRHGELLEDVVRSMLGETSATRWASERDDQSGAGAMFLAELGRGRGMRRAMIKRAANRSWRRATSRSEWAASAVSQASTRGSAPGPSTTGGDAKPAGKVLEPELGLVGCASGNLALLYFTFQPGRVSLEDLTARYPNLVDSLVAHPGVGIVVAHSSAEGPVVRSKTGRMRLSASVVEGEDPLGPYGPHARSALAPLNTFSNTGDLAIISPIDPVTGEVLSYEELVGSHGGLGGWQQEPFLMRPAEWELRSPTLVGAPAVYGELMGWLADLRSGAIPPSSATPRSPQGNLAG